MPRSTGASPNGATPLPPAPGPALPPDPAPVAPPAQSLADQLRAMQVGMRTAITGNPDQPTGQTTTLVGWLLASGRAAPPLAPPGRPRLLGAAPGSPPARPLTAEEELAQGYHRPANPSGSLRLRLPGGRRLWWAYAGGAAVTLYLLGVLGLALAAWAGDHWATLQYGDPRTTHLAALTGLPGEAAGSPTLITAVNDGGTAHVFILPGGQGAKAYVIEQPIPEDPGGRQPLVLALRDVDRDGHLDLVATLGGTGTMLVWLQDTGKGVFRPLTPAEQQRLAASGP